MSRLQEDAESACLGLGGSINAQDKEGGGLSKSDFVDAGVALFAGTLKEKEIRRVVELGGVQARAVTASIGAGARKGGLRTGSSRLAKSMPSTRCVSPEEKGNGHGGEVGKAEGRHSWSFPKDVLGKHLGRVGAGGMKKRYLSQIHDFPLSPPPPAPALLNGSHCQSPPPLPLTSIIFSSHSRPSLLHHLPNP